MKIRIITIHFIPNFGSIFQSYGLYTYIKKLGYKDVKIIDYRPSYFKPVRSLRSFIGYLLNFSSYHKRKRKFDQFLLNNIELTERYNDLRSLEKNVPYADLYISGGDQLWNPFHDCGKDDAYKLTFTDGIKISYSTSIGQSNISMEDLVELGNKISSYRSVSVREECSVYDLKKLGIDAFQAVDPVFLLDVVEYKKFITPVKVKENYLLVYLVEPSKMLDECIEYLSKKYNLKVVSCSGFSRKFKCDYFLKDLGPDEILSYIVNAKIILSASFHATVFSILFKKQFFTLLPNIHTNERIINLLNKYDLKNRIITDYSIEQLDSSIEYSKLNSITEEINNSKDYIKRCIIDARNDK